MILLNDCVDDYILCWVYAHNFVNQRHIVNYFAVIVEINEMK